MTFRSKFYREREIDFKRVRNPVIKIYSTRRKHNSVPLSCRNWYIAGNHRRFSAASESETAVKLRAKTAPVIRDNRVRMGYVQLHPHINYPALAIWE